MLQLLRYVYLFRREYRQSLKQMEDYYDEDCRLRWVKVCFYSAFGIGLWALVSLFSGNFLYCLFIVAYTAYYACMVHRFSNYMTNAKFLISVLSAKPVPAGDIPVDDGGELTEEDKNHLSEKELRLQAALEKWVADKGYCRGDVGTDNIVLSLGTNRNFLRYYFRTRMTTDLRTCRNELRVAKAKRIMTECPDISLDKLCRMVGFNDPANLHRQFQKITGQTPFDFKNSLNKRS